MFKANVELFSSARLLIIYSNNQKTMEFQSFLVITEVISWKLYICIMHNEPLYYLNFFVSGKNIMNDNNNIG